MAKAKELIYTYKPLGKKLLLDIPETKAGAIGVHQGAQIQEQGTIIAMGDAVPVRESVTLTTTKGPKTVYGDGFAVGDVIQVKAWSIDIFSVDGKKYYYVSYDSDAICGILQKD